MSYDQKLQSAQEIIENHNSNVDDSNKVDFEQFMQNLRNLGGTSDDTLKAVSWEDFERFPTYDTNRNRLVMPSEYLMVDVFQSQLWICKHTRKKYNCGGRSIKFKPIVMVIEDCNKLLGSVWNGYWLIPDLNED